MWGWIIGAIILAFVYLKPDWAGKALGETVGSLGVQLGNAVWSFIDTLSFRVGDSIAGALNVHDWNDGKKKWVGLLTVLEVTYWVSRATSPKIQITTGGVSVTTHIPATGGTITIGKTGTRRVVRRPTRKVSRAREVESVEVVEESEPAEEAIEEPVIVEEPIVRETTSTRASEMIDEEQIRRALVEYAEDVGKKVEDLVEKDIQVMTAELPKEKRRTHYDRYMEYVRRRKAEGKVKPKKKRRY